MSSDSGTSHYLFKVWQRRRIRFGPDLSLNSSRSSSELSAYLTSSSLLSLFKPLNGMFRKMWSLCPMNWGLSSVRVAVFQSNFIAFWASSFSFCCALISEASVLEISVIKGLFSGCFDVWSSNSGLNFTPSRSILGVSSFERSRPRLESFFTMLKNSSRLIVSTDRLSSSYFNFELSVVRYNPYLSSINSGSSKPASTRVLPMPEPASSY